jgi:hypothetical protein
MSSETHTKPSLGFLRLTPFWAYQPFRKPRLASTGTPQIAGPAYIQRG